MSPTAIDTASIKSAVQRYREAVQPWPVTVAGVTFLVRRPDIRILAYHGLIEFPLLSEVGRLINQWMGQDLTEPHGKKDTQTEGRDPSEGRKAEAVINAIVCGGCVEPLVFMRPDLIPPGVDALTIHDIPMDHREQLANAILLGDPSKPSREEEAKQAAGFRDGGDGKVPPSDG